MICCVTGERPEKFPFLYMNSVEYALYFAKLSDKIEDLICEGYTHFISGMATSSFYGSAGRVLAVPDCMRELLKQENAQMISYHITRALKVLKGVWGKLLKKFSPQKIFT